MIWSLPTSLEAGGKSWAIRTDYRDVLNILLAFGDPDLSPKEKMYVCLRVLYVDFAEMPADTYTDAYAAAIAFIDNGQADKKQTVRTMDWEQDAPLIFPAINRVAGMEVRAVEYMHWWTFMGYFMEIQKSIYSHVLALRSKKAKRKKLDKEEEEFWRQNKHLCELKPKLTKKEREEKEQLKKLLGM